MWKDKMMIKTTFLNSTINCSSSNFQIILILKKFELHLCILHTQKQLSLTLICTRNMKRCLRNNFFQVACRFNQQYKQKKLQIFN